MRRLTRRRLVSTAAAAGALPACVADARRSAERASEPDGRAPVSVELLAGLTPQQQATLQPLVVDAFGQAHPDLRLVVIEHPPAQTDQKLLSLMAGGTPPDVVYSAPPSLFRGKVTQDVTERVRRDRLDVRAYAKEGFDSAATWRDRIVGWPYYVGGNSSVLPYNRDLFRNAGVPEPPVKWGAAEWNATTWLQALQRTTVRDASGMPSAYGTNITLVTFYAYYLSTLWNGAWISAGTNTATCDSPPMIEAFEFFAGLATQHRVAATAAQLQEAFGDASPEKAFLNGQLAMYATPGAQNLATVPPAVRERGLRLAYAPLPTFKTFGAAHYYLNNGLVTGARQPDAGWAYMKWVAATPNWCISRGQPPARAALFDTWAKTVYDGIGAQVRLEVLKESLRRPIKLDPLFHLPAQQRMQAQDLIQAALDQVWAGQIPAAQALRQLKSQLAPLVPSDAP